MKSGLSAVAPALIEGGAVDLRERVDAIYRSESRRVFATLIRLLGDLDLAEEALHDAFRAALEQWPREGMRAQTSCRNAAFSSNGWRSWTIDRASVDLAARRATIGQRWPPAAAERSTPNE